LLVGAIQDHQAWVHPPGLMIVDAPITASDLAQSVARLRHRGDDILLESRWLSTSRWWYSYQFAVGCVARTDFQPDPTGHSTDVACFLSR